MQNKAISYTKPRRIFRENGPKFNLRSLSMPKKNNAKNQVRIIGGQWRGRKLPVLDLPGLRPTGDRRRETLFNWLAPYIEGARILDAFAGSGALAFEAMSRGASEALLLEISSQAVRNLQQNILALDADSQAQTNCTDALSFFDAQPTKDKNSATFDIVFLDPPFRENLLDRAIEKLNSSQILSTNALIYLELESRKGLPKVPKNWSLLKEKSQGEVTSLLYRAGK